MKRKKGLAVLKFMYFFTCLFFLFSNYAHAYIDPSAVTYVIQAVAGVCIAVGAACTVYRHKIAKFFRKMKKKHSKKQSNKEKESNE